MPILISSVALAMTSAVVAFALGCSLPKVMAIYIGSGVLAVFAQALLRNLILPTENRG
ncbi:MULTISPECIES: hypothetical protein [Paracoccus]|jgi:L-lactate permease|uniref:Uncharacterized protein n=1 Tax=Paracoccus litorisediminis TaxID=2006130 RepID=A0A844HQZ5_9RHOB|nr:MULTISPECIES: hypothetical protein [Paracoccus]MBD9528822.1 hypothetical protein [Paracoccus sp. PAR01]MTH60091.1 hypothetical protein [Paracoccus litorisediminis]